MVEVCRGRTSTSGGPLVGFRPAASSASRSSLKTINLYNLRVSDQGSIRMGTRGRTSIRIDHASASARSAARTASLARSLSCWARICAPMIRPPKACSRDRAFIAADYSAACRVMQRH